MLKCIKERIEATATAGNRVSSIDALFLLLRADPCIAQYQWFREALSKILKRACSMSSSIFSVGKRLNCIEDLRHACIQNNVKQDKWLKEKRHQIENSTNFKSRETRTAYGEVALKKSGGWPAPKLSFHCQKAIFGTAANSFIWIWGLALGKMELCHMV